MKKQIKSKERVIGRGEVFTSEREVNAMLDMVKHETERIDSRFLEPACGTGNFLIEILKRKMSVVKKMYQKNIFDYERYAVLCITSIYGVDIMEDNVEECRERLFNKWDEEYTRIAKKQANDKCREVIKFILKKNILCGDALTMLQNDGNPIVFAEWSFVTKNMIKRRDFELNQLLMAAKKQTTLFMTGWNYNKETQTFIPSPIKEHPLTDYMRKYELFISI